MSEAQSGGTRKDESRAMPATGCGPNAPGPFSQSDYHHPAAAWGASKSVGLVLLRQGEIIDGTRAVFRMNHENGGFDCPGCAWPDDRKGLHMDICENGIKHVTWEMTRKRVTREFFAAHTVSELTDWTDFALENEGRLTEPMSYNAATDRYEPISWNEAFALIGTRLRSLASPNEASFYTSGRLSNEATFLYQLFAREFGTNNLPDCSNMCHEASGRALTAALGTGKGTVDLVDWQKADAIFVIGVNAATNTPRMLTALADGVKERGLKIVHINPLIEAAATRAITPHEILDMMLFRATPTSTLNLQPRIAADMALMRGIAKHLLEAARTDPKAIDAGFIEHYTAGFAAYRAACEAVSWAEVERQSGVPVDQIRAAAEIYRQARSCVISWCLGVTQQNHGVDTIREIVNVLLLRGNIGREGAGPCPIRGHSNVQGNRTCGIDHRPSEAWLARLDATCGITSPRAHGLDTVQHDQGHAPGRRESLCGDGRQFRHGDAGQELHVRGPAPLRFDRACQHEAQPQPPGSRAGSFDPALPGAHRKGQTACRAAAGHGRGLHEHGPLVEGDEGTGLAAAPFRTGHHRRDCPGDAAGVQHALGGIRCRLRPHPGQDGRSARGVRGLQPPGPPALGLPPEAARPRIGVPNRDGIARTFPRPHCPTSSCRRVG